MTKIKKIKKFIRKLFGTKKKSAPVEKISEEDEKQISVINADKVAKQELRRKRTEQVMELTGWDSDTAFRSYRRAFKDYGINFNEYIKYEVYKMSSEAEIEKCRQDIAIRKIAKKIRRESLRRAAGGEDHSSYDIYLQAHKNYGIGFTDYLDNEIFKYPPDEQEHIWKTIQAEKNAKESEEKKANREKCIEKIMHITGLDHDTVVQNVSDAYERTGCSTLEYFEYRLFEMTPEQQQEVCLNSTKKELNHIYNTNRTFTRIAKNKACANNYFSSFLNRKWCMNFDIDFDEFRNLFSNCNRIIFKPIYGHKGFGIEAFDINVQNIETVFNKLYQYPCGVVEEYVDQHPDLSRLCPDSVNTLRVVTVCSKDHPVTPDGKFSDVAYAALRIGAGHSIVDNFHSGGMCSSVDLSTGILDSHATDMECNTFVKHPMTGIEIKGFRIPFYKEAIELVEKACAMNLVEGLIGWDIAIAKDGPVLIEVNMQPGTVLLSTPYSIDKRPSKCVLEKYIKQNEDYKSIKSIISETGCDEVTAKSQLVVALDKYGICASDYIRYRLYDIPEEERGAEWSRITALKELSKKENSDNNDSIEIKGSTDSIIAEISRRTGWSIDKVKIKLEEAKKQYKCVPVEYLRYRFYEKNAEEIQRFCLRSDMLAIGERYNTNKKFMDLARSKTRTNAYFTEFIHRGWISNNKLSPERMNDLFADCDRIIYKPMYSFGGRHIQAFDVASYNLEELRRILVALPYGIVEEYIVQHHELSKLCPGSVNTMRIGAVVSKTDPVAPDGRNIDIAYAVLRLGSGTSVVDNLSSGGMCAAIDLNTGELITNGVDRACNEFETHPYTGVRIKGFKIPLFNEAIKLVEQACEKKLTQGYIGWDVAITETGPELIELNFGAGSDALSVPYMYQNVDTKHILSKYLFDYNECQHYVDQMVENKGISREKAITIMMKEWREKGTSFLVNC